MDLEDIFPGLQGGFAIDAPGPEHIVSAEQIRTIQEDPGVCVETLKNELQTRIGSQLVRNGEFCSIDPIRTAHPL